MIRMYISGKITGLPFNEVEAKFQQAEWLLEDLDVEPVNPLKNGLTVEHTWHEHMVKDIEMLLSCDAIYLFDNWVDSKGARIEKNIADELGMNVWFESKITHDRGIVLQIQNAIHEATGMSFKDYTTKSRKRDTFFARMIFVHHCTLNGVDPIKYIDRDRTMIYYYMNQYANEVKFNAQFRDMAKRVEDRLNFQNKDV